MMVDVTTQIIIKRPQDSVFKYASNPENAPEWYVNIKSVEWRTQKRVAVGSKIAFKATFLGRQLEYVYEMTDLVPGQKLVMRTADGPFLMETSYVWEKIDDNTTRMTLRNSGNPTGFSQLFAPLMALAMKKANKSDLERLKKIMEK